MTRPVCSVEGCAGTAVARGWCFPHYQSWRRQRPEVKEKRRGYMRAYFQLLREDAMRYRALVEKGA